MYNYENKEYLEKLNLKDESWYTDILNLVKKKNPQKILEVGCGDGAFTRILNKNKIKTLSIDNSKTFLDYAKKHGKSEFIQIDLNKDELNTIKEKFDAVVLLDVLEHIKNKEKVISQIKDRLKENGSFIFQCPNLYCNLISVNYKHNPLNMIKKTLRGINGFFKYKFGIKINEITKIKEGLDFKIADHDAVTLTSPYWFLGYFKKNKWKIEMFTSYSFSTKNKFIKKIIGLGRFIPFIKYLGGKMIFVVKK